MKVRYAALCALAASTFLVAAPLLAAAPSKTCTTTEAAIANSATANHFDQSSNGTITIFLRGTKKSITLQQALDGIKSTSQAIKNPSLPQASCAEATVDFDVMTRAARAAALANAAAARAAFDKVNGPAAARRKAEVDAATKAYDEAVAPQLKLQNDTALAASNIEKLIAANRVNPTIAAR